MNSPGQNVVSLRDGRAVIGVALDGASPCLTSYSFAKGLDDEGRARLSATANPEGWETELRRVRDAGHIMPVEFDGRPAGLTALVLLGSGDPEHGAEWMGRVAGRLKVPCGYLGVSAGWHLLEKPDGFENDPYFKYLEIPPGEYLVEVLAYLPADEVLFGPDGGGRLFTVPGRKRGVPIGRYFRLTRPNEPPPDWLKAYLTEYPSHDPGHEEEWEDEDEGEIEVEGNLLHVIRLNPAGDSPRPPKELWLPFEVRSLPKCPLGLPLLAMRGKARPPRCVS
jgi:hypothetical protein